MRPGRYWIFFKPCRMTLDQVAEACQRLPRDGALGANKPLCERTLASCIRVLGDDHGWTGNVRRNLNMAQELTLTEMMIEVHPGRMNRFTIRATLKWPREAGTSCSRPVSSNQR